MSFTHIPDTIPLTARQMNRIHERMRELVVQASTHDGSAGAATSRVKHAVYQDFAQHFGLLLARPSRKDNDLPNRNDMRNLPETVRDLKMVLTHILPDQQVLNELKEPRFKICGVGSEEYFKRESVALTKQISATLLSELPQLLAPQRSR